MKFLSTWKSVALAILLSVCALPAMAQSLTTTYASNNADAGNTFDVTPSINVTIDSFDVNLGVYGGESGAGAGQTSEVAIYWRPGTSNGFESTSTGWTLLGTASVVTQGTDIPTHVPIGGLALTAGQTYGFYVHLQTYPSGGVELLYTNAEAPTVFANSDLSLTTYYGMADPVFSYYFGYRQWNGTVHYSVKAATTCASEGYTGMKLDWCKNVCEKGYTGTQLKIWLQRWMDRYHNLPYCAREDEEEEQPQQQG